MKLQKKIMFIMVATWAIICILVFADSKFIITEDYKNLEKQITQHRIHDTERALDRMLYTLSLYTVAWSQWNDSYQFMSNKHNNFIQSNLIDATYRSSDIDFILFFDNTGNLYFGQYYDADHDKIMPVPPAILNILKSDKAFFSHQTKDSVKLGILQTPLGLIALCARPILKSNGTGPVKGSLFMGYYLDNVFFNTLGQTVGMPVHFFPMNEVTKDPQLNMIYDQILSGSRDTQITVNNKLKYGFIILRDIYAAPVGLIRISMPRAVYQQGLWTAYNYSIIVVLSAMIVTLLVWYLLKTFVLNRIFTISKQIQAISQSKHFDHQILLSGHDELKRMVFIINDMLNIIATSQKRLNYLAMHDILTGLPNRAYFFRLLKQAMDSANINHTKLAVMFLDMDKLKKVNDNYGHLVGDKIIKQAADRMLQLMHKEDVISRLAGDEFVIFMPEIHDILLVTDMAQQILHATSQPYHIDGYTINISFSIGISIFPDDGDTIEKLIQHADDVMYLAKRSGNSYQYYDDEVHPVT